ncbi:hypothetical protein ACJ41O_003189 [Fusarium nematophilum]
MLSNYLYLVLGLWSALCAAADAARDGTFKDPAARSRPRFRYWLPDASVDADTVSTDLKAAADIGAGGVEFVPFYNYGGKQGGAPQNSDWARYGFGTEAFHRMFKMALRTHADNGLFMDFPLGPNQGQGVPAEYGDEGLQWNLLAYTAAVPANGSFDGFIPGWGAGDLVALTSALTLSGVERTRVAQDFSGKRNLTWMEYRLSHKSLRDITNLVNKSTGAAQVEFSEAEANTDHRIFAFYQTQPHYKNLEFPNRNPSGIIFDNGSLVVDHHSRRGAQTMIDFWEKHMLDEETLDLIRQAGNYVWEDSVEIVSNITWTPSLPVTFKKMHGYDIKPILPLLVFNQSSIYAQRESFGAFDCHLDTRYEGIGYVHDFRATLEFGYNEYISTLRNWSNTRLGLPYSNQPTYGLPQDMTAAIPHVDIPEYESLAFGNSIDNYRRFVGTAHLAGKNIISNELGAAVLKAYRLTIPELIRSVHLAVVGGTNQLILHGQTYSGAWYGTTWPGYTPFQYLFSELYSPKQPAWGHGMADVINYFARLQFIQRQGTPRTDVAVLNKMSRTAEQSPPIYTSRDLEQNGWTYSYISPLAFDLPQSRVQDNLLGPDGPAWQALVVQHTENLTTSAIETLRTYSEEGLPIILSGGIPAYWATRSRGNKKQFQNAVEQLVNSENVHLVDEGQVASKLAALGLHPRAYVAAPSIVHTTWREDVDNEVNYAFLYNDQNVSVSGKATFQGSGRAFILDAWTGEEAPVWHYQDDGGVLEIPIKLAPQQAVIMAVRKQGPGKRSSSRCHFTHLPNGVLGVTRTLGTLNIRVPAIPPANGTLSSGEVASLDAGAVPKPSALSGWTLTAEQWERPSDLYDQATIAVKRNTTITVDSLRSWHNIDGLADAMGVGYYSTKFDWSASDATGAYLNVTGITHTLQVTINGETVEPFDHANAVRDISRHLVKGNNSVLIRAPTTMWNYLRSISEDIRESGARPQGLIMASMAASLFPPQNMGLVGEVVLVPFNEVTVACS